MTFKTSFRRLRVNGFINRIIVPEIYCILVLFCMECFFVLKLLWKLMRFLNFSYLISKNFLKFSRAN